MDSSDKCRLPRRVDDVSRGETLNLANKVNLQQFAFCLLYLCIQIGSVSTWQTERKFKRANIDLLFISFYKAENVILLLIISISMKSTYLPCVNFNPFFILCQAQNIPVYLMPVLCGGHGCTFNQKWLNFSTSSSVELSWVQFQSKLIQGTMQKPAPDPQQGTGVRKNSPLTGNKLKQDQTLVFFEYI